MMNEKKLFYERPQQEVVVLTVTNALLVGSGGGKGGLNNEDFSPAIDGFMPDDNITQGNSLPPI